MDRLKNLIIKIILKLDRIKELQNFYIQKITGNKENRGLPSDGG